MNEVIFQTKYAWIFKTELWPDRIVYTAGIPAKQTEIPLRNISSLDVGIINVPGLGIRTSDGNTFKINISAKAKERLVKILRAQGTAGN